MDTYNGDLLAGPRGRRLCWAVLFPSTEPAPAWAWEAASSPTAQRIHEVAHELSAIDPAPAVGDRTRMITALHDAVGAARYWQPPEEKDLLLQDPAVQEALVPVAQALETAAEAAWWTRPMAGTPQHYVQWLDSYPSEPPQLFRARERLQTWRRQVLEVEEEHRSSALSPDPPTTGPWWSTPILSGLTTTTGPGPGLETAGLALVEDAYDPTQARLWPLAPYEGVRVFKITGPEDWADLVAEYPLELSWSKGMDWSVITGKTGPWVAPDWAAVAVDYDAVHLSVRGYLSTAGRAIPVRNAFSVLAGWDPDTTWWLTDSLYEAGPITEWTRPTHNRLIWKRRPMA